MKQCRFCSTCMSNEASSCPSCGLSQYDGSVPFTAYEVPETQQPFNRSNGNGRNASRRYREQKRTAQLIGALIAFGIGLFAVKVYPVIKAEFEKGKRIEENIAQHSEMMSEWFAGTGAGLNPADYSNMFNAVQADEYYEVVSTESYRNTLGLRVIVRKVLAKKDAELMSVAVFSNADGQTIDKASDKICLCEGEYNFFRYIIPGGVPEDAEPAYSEYNMVSMYDGEKNAVELTDWKCEDQMLDMTVRQTKEPLGAYAKFKLLFYQDGKLVRDECASFDMYTNELKKTGSEARVMIPVFDMEFDSLEYYFEP